MGSGSKKNLFAVLAIVLAAASALALGLFWIARADAQKRLEQRQAVESLAAAENAIQAVTPAPAGRADGGP